MFEKCRMDQSLALLEKVVKIQIHLGQAFVRVSQFGLRTFIQHHGLLTRKRPVLTLREERSQPLMQLETAFRAVSHNPIVPGCVFWGAEILKKRQRVTRDRA
jgi:hypothetical protein